MLCTARSIVSIWPKKTNRTFMWRVQQGALLWHNVNGGLTKKSPSKDVDEQLRAIDSSESDYLFMHCSS